MCDEIVDIQANYQGSRYDGFFFIRVHTLAVIYSVNGEGVC